MRVINPFRVVKANEFTISQIVENWIPFVGSKGGFVAQLNPQELMPKYVLGSKGCGKTHLLLYHSFDARFSLYKNDIRTLLKQDKYLASYSRLDILSSSRFSRRANEEEWRVLYNFYFEIVQSLFSLDVYEKVIESLGVTERVQSIVIETIRKQVDLALEGNTIRDLREYLNRKRKTIDDEITDYAYTKKLNWERVRPDFPFGSLLFEIPKAFSSHVNALRDVNYIYILDEYEKLQCDWQKESLNTLVYEKKYNSTFWVGARKIGYTTRRTLTGEIIHEGHEFSPVDMDVMLKETKDQFLTFSVNLFNKRRTLSGIENLVPPNVLFEEYDENLLLSRLLNKGDSLRHWKTFKERLYSIGIKGEEEILSFQKSLMDGVEQDLLGQKLKLYAFYIAWSKNKATKEQIPAIIDSVNHSYEEYKAGANPIMKEWYRKFRQDFVAQLAEENKEPLYQYSGFKRLVKIADGNPRVFLTLMKLIIDDCYFRGIDPFEEKGRISVRSQYAGINETAKWFQNDIEVYGREREELDMAMNHLMSFMYVSRFCDKPTETSLCAFYYRMNAGQKSIDRVIGFAIQEAFLVETPNKRKDKALGIPQRSYQINRLIATRFSLPIARRGVISIPPDMMSAIFDPEYYGSFNSFLTAHKMSLNAPFVYRKARLAKKEEPGLFD